ncbi:DUF1851 domain-containing protein [Xanthomonas cerealis pv. cerealis]|uniref:DUF1851 domain-containing protein n=1 Tax=Xanthomonas cerealis pv. cerealis TaxID=152263 RepID=A0A514EFM6_9XANT|nr:GAD-like domain-containing protein [Xanthomonas translucens]QDI04826.1 DUF1851 domain-containing protein [Xanthomonas translucens pv. cerealis]
MRGEDFEIFIEEFGEPTLRRDVPEEALRKWAGKLPGRLLEYWQLEGWSQYADGLFWIVDPDEFEGVTTDWLSGTPLVNIDKFHTIARSAFGSLYLCGETTGRNITINCSIHGIAAVPRELKPKTPVQLDKSIRAFFGSSSPDRFDLDDEQGKPLFRRALSNLGPLEQDEVYGFEPAIASGGRLILENLKRMKAEQHLTILRQLAAPRIPFLNENIDKIS